jgi:hypothetical protein
MSANGFRRAVKEVYVNVNNVVWSIPHDEIVDEQTKTMEPELRSQRCPLVASSTTPTFGGTSSPQLSVGRFGGKK